MNCAVSSSHVISTDYLHQIISTNCDDDDNGDVDEDDCDEDVKPSHLNYNLFPHIFYLKHMHHLMFKLQNIHKLLLW